MRKLQVLPFQEKDRETLEKWRLEFVDATLEHSQDYKAPQTETAVVRNSDGKIIMALHGVMSSVLGPLIKNPDANRLEVLEALIVAEGALNYKAVQAGAVSSFIVVPEKMVKYISTLEKLGYHIHSNHCVVMERSLVVPEPVIHERETVAEPVPADVESEDEIAAVAETS